MSAELNGWTHVPVNFQDYDTPDQEYLDVQADNTIAMQAEIDAAAIRDDLKNMPHLDVELTGLKEIDVLDPVIGQTDAEKEWNDMPEYNQQDETAWRTIKIHFPNDGAVRKFSVLLDQSLTDKTKYLWYPPALVRHAHDKAYVPSEAQTMMDDLTLMEET
jgi:hypothetical protein